MATRAIANLLEEAERRRHEKKQACARKRFIQFDHFTFFLNNFLD